MLEALATWVLNQYLGKYVENLNTDQLSIALLKGSVELENLPLRKDALRHLGLPFKIKAGFIGKVKLNIPLTRLRSSPWVVSMEQLYVIVCPLHPEEFDPAVEEEYALERKMAVLDVVEASWRAGIEEKSGGSQYASTYAYYQFGSGTLMADVLENIQLDIKDVHIRVEDDLTEPKVPFSFGITLESLTAKTTDASWIPRFVTRDKASFSYKLVELRNLAVYWNIFSQFYGDKKIGELASTLFKQTKEKRGYDYVLSPVSGQANLKRNLSAAALRSKSTPRIHCDLSLQEINISFTQLQYQSLIGWLKGLAFLDRNRKYCKWRPNVPVKGNAKLWWEFAVNCHLEKSRRYRRQRSMEFILRRAREMIVYVEIYRRHLLDPMSLSAHEKEAKNHIEKIWTYEELRIVRQLAMDDISMVDESETASKTPSATNVTKTTGFLQRIFPMWYGWYSSTPPEGSADNGEASAITVRDDSDSNVRDTTETSALEEELLDALEESLDLAENQTYMKRDAVFLGMNFDLNRVALSLTKLIVSSSIRSGQKRWKHLARTRPICEFRCEHMKLGIESRPRTKSYQLKVSVKSVSVEDKWTEGSIFPWIISPIGQRDSGMASFPSSLKIPAFASTSTAGPHPSFTYAQSQADAALGAQQLFDLMYEVRPEGAGEKMFRLFVSSKSLDVVYNPKFMSVVRDFFVTPFEVCEPTDLSPVSPDDCMTDYSDEQQANARMNAAFSTALAKYEELKQQAKDELKKEILELLEGKSTTRRSWEISLDLVAPQIILPESFTEKNARIVVVDLGKLHLCNLSRSGRRSEERRSSTTTGGESGRESGRQTEAEGVSSGVSAPVSSDSRHPSGFDAPDWTADRPFPRVRNDTVDSEEGSDVYATPYSSTPASGASSAGEKRTQENTRVDAGCDEFQRTGFESRRDTLRPASGGNDLEFTPDVLRDKVYDKYLCELGDLQIVVAHAKEIWRSALYQGYGPLHILDRFSISLLIERRVVQTSDPRYPSVAVSGNLEKLMLHLNEQKLYSLAVVLYSLRAADNQDSSRASPGCPSPRPMSQGSAVGVDLSQSFPVNPGTPARRSRPSYLWLPETAERLYMRSKEKKLDSPLATHFSPTSVLLEMKFDVERLSFEVQSRGLPVAELQVSGVKMDFVKRPLDSTVCVSIHELLLADAMQTYGPDYELLLASHKHVTIDSISGSIRQSEPGSPASPASPASPELTRAASPATVPPTDSSANFMGAFINRMTTFWVPPPPPPPDPRSRSKGPGPMPVSLFDTRTTALVSSSSSQALLTHPRLNQTFSRELMTEPEAEALISGDITITEPYDPDDLDAKTTISANLKFNTLDMIANQETIVELVSFAHRLSQMIRQAGKIVSRRSVRPLTTDATPAAADSQIQSSAGFSFSSETVYSEEDEDADTLLASVPSSTNISLTRTESDARVCPKGVQSVEVPHAADQRPDADKKCSSMPSLRFGGSAEDVRIPSMHRVSARSSTMPLSAAVQTPSAVDDRANNTTISRLREEKQKMLPKVEVTVNFEFHRFHVLFLRSVRRDLASKVATATISGACIRAMIHDDVLDVGGSLGGLQLLDLTQSNLQAMNDGVSSPPLDRAHSYAALPYQRVLSVGHDPLADPKLSNVCALNEESPASLLARLHRQAYGKAEEQSDTATESKEEPNTCKETIRHAFSFHVVMKDIGQSPATKADGSPVPAIGLDLYIASVSYVHSPNFLVELSACASEFRAYAAKLAQYMTNAAAEVALELLTERTEQKSAASRTLTDRPWSLFARLSSPMVPVEPRPLTAEVSSPEKKVPSPSIIEALRITATLETPVIVLPMGPNNPNVLVARLGRIFVRNAETRRVNLDGESPTGVTDAMDSTETRRDTSFGGHGVHVARYEVLIQDMNVHNMNLEDKMRFLAQSLNETNPSPFDFLLEMRGHGTRADNPWWSRLRVAEIFACKTPADRPILHDTKVHVDLGFFAAPLVFDGERRSSPLSTPVAALSGSDTTQVDFYPDVVQANVSLVDPLKISLSKSQYQQILRTFDYALAFPDGERQPVQRARVLSGFGSDASDAEDLSYGPTVTARTRDDPTESDSTEKKPPTGILLKSNFEVPEFTMVLKGDPYEGEQAIVSLNLKNFAVNFESTAAFEKTVEISLFSVSMEDLTEPEDSPVRTIMLSHGKMRTDAEVGKSRAVYPYGRPLSVSCPDLTSVDPTLAAYYSMPERLDAPNAFSHLRKPHRKMSAAGEPKISGRRNHSIHEESTASMRSPQSPGHGVSDEPNPERDSSLVKINVLMVDRNHPEFATKFESVSKFIDVDFNELDIRLNPPSWVKVLDFFGISTANATIFEVAPSHTSLGVGVLSRESSGVELRRHPTHESVSAQFSAASVTSAEPRELFREDNQPLNSKLDINVHSLGFILQGTSGDLAQATICNFQSNMNSRDGNLEMNGRLGSLAICDLSPQSGLYQQKFRTAGEEILHFHFFKHGDMEYLESAVDREFDGHLKLNMSSIVYVHTHRFMCEVIDFFLSFADLQKVLGRLRAGALGAELYEVPRHGFRCLLDVRIDNPVIIIPHSATNPLGIVVDLGQISATNTFKVAGSEGTISYQGLKTKSNAAHRREAPSSNAANATLDCVYPCLLDVISIDLINMDVFAVEVCPPELSLSKRRKRKDTQRNDCEILTFGTAYTMRLMGPSFLKDKGKLKVQVERNLDGEMSHDIANLVIKADLFSMELLVDLEQYKLIRGLLNYNLGDNLEHVDENDIASAVARFQEMERALGASSEHLPDDARSIHAFTSSPPASIVSGDEREVWTTFALIVDLNDVSLRAKRSRCDVNPLAKINFIQSRLTMESHTDGSKDIDLVSEEIRLHDLRFLGAPHNQRSNVFTSILQPLRRDVPNSSPEKGGTFQSKTTMQAEVHYRQSKEFTRLTILLNAMRLTAIFDWWRAVLDFVCATPDPPLEPIAEKPLPAKTDKATQEPPSASASLLHLELAPDTSLVGPTPIQASMGIFTKREASPPHPSFELKLNVTESEIVVLENSSQVDTNAVIFKTTAVISHRPDFPEKPLSVSLTNCEVFSCLLGTSEEDTALSIIEPVSLNLEISAKRRSRDRARSPGILDAAPPEYTDQTLEIVFPQHFKVRFSYNDMKMFLRIMNSLQSQANGQAFVSDSPAPAAPARKTSAQRSFPANVRAQISNLEALGFAESDCVRALKEANGKLDDAALWLLQNAEPIKIEEESSSTLALLDTTGTVKPSGETNAAYRCIEIRLPCLSLCIIDDCKDSDVPLAEFSFNHLAFSQDMVQKSGFLVCTVAGDFYNRDVSGWEPFLEPWKFDANWAIGEASGKKDIVVGIKSEEVLNLNLTSSLIDLYSIVSANWRDDYYQVNSSGSASSTTLHCNIFGNDEKLIPVSGPSRSNDSEGTSKALPGTSQRSDVTNFKRRSPFIPFALKNDTGSPLWLRGAGSGMSIRTFQTNDTRRNGSQIFEVAPGETLPFAFKERIRARHTQDSKSDASHVPGDAHKIIVKVDGWRESKPVTIDKIGVYFRDVAPDVLIADVAPPSKLIFAVSTEGSARKLVTIRSAFLITNKLTDAVEISLDSKPVGSSFPAVGGAHLVKIRTGETYPIPLKSVQLQCGVIVRPILEGNPFQFGFCKEPLPWHKVATPQDSREFFHICKPLVDTEENPYRICARVNRLAFPTDQRPQSSRTTTAANIQPAHTIVLKPPITIVNLLPYDLFYLLSSTDTSEGARLEKAEGIVKPGKEAAVHQIDLAERIEVGFSLENMQKTSNIQVSPRSGNTYLARVTLLDADKRPLELKVKITPRQASIKFTVFAPYWLVNRTGLPLIFRQDGVSQEFAGQSHEHEIGRSMEPLLFSLSDPASPPFLVARVGKELHLNGSPQWSRNFHLEKPACVRRLRVSLRDHQKPDIVYSISVRIQPGRGRYRDTHIVTFSPRFQVYNRSSHSLQFAQKKFAIDDFVGENGSQAFLEAKPDSHLSFHWPRDDCDHLLCVRMADVFACHWSGGFPLDKIQSFNLNIRDVGELSLFLHVETVLEGATYFVIFMDAAVLPPPLRLDNYSEVQVTYYQNGVTDAHRQSIVKPHSSLPYAWDEPILPPEIAVVAPGGVSTIVNMDQLNQTSQLTYENFLYLALTCTFPSDYSFVPTSDRKTNFPLDMGNQCLVLDVIELNSTIDATRLRQKKYKIVLRPKEPGRRSQLWRMTSDGKLAHEGTSPPQDPKLSTPQKNQENMLVLDIDTKAVLPDEYMPLTLRPPDNRRRLTQHWRFAPEGRLCCMHENLCVQAKDGFRGIVDGTEVVLGPVSKRALVTMDNGVPAEQAISRQRLRPGSGFLEVKVTTDGPTRVLQIKDQAQKNIRKTEWVLSAYNDASAMPSRLTWRASPNEESELFDLRTPQDGSRWDVNESSDFRTLTFKRRRTSKTEKSKMPSSFRLNIVLTRGLGLSVVSQTPECAEELAYASFTKVIAEIVHSGLEVKIDGSIENIQVDNPSFDAQIPVVLAVSSSSREDENKYMPFALHFNVHKLSSPDGPTSAQLFRHIMVNLKPLSVNLEEKHLCKLLAFAGLNKSDAELEKESGRTGEDSESDYQAVSAAAASSAQATRYYLGLLKMTLCQIRLSVYRSGRMPPSLIAVKRKLGLTLFQFEDAHIELHPFVKTHVFETMQFLVQCFAKHYAKDFVSQIAKILGSTDLLGNPLGFFTDVTEGLSEFVTEGNVTGLVKNVTHGVANSAAKVTGTISDAVGLVTLDEDHEAERQRIRSLPQHQRRVGYVALSAGPSSDTDEGLVLAVRGDEPSSSIPPSASYEHLKAGFQGLFHGLSGGMLSLITQPYEGFLSDGVTGFVSGLGKGLVGTVTKPAVGILDLATETANAVRDRSRSESRLMPLRIRPPRVVCGPHATLPRYSKTQALGQEFLYFLNDKDMSEVFIAFEKLREGVEDMAALLSSRSARILTRSGLRTPYSVVVEFRMSELHHADAVVSRGEGGKDMFFIKLVMEAPETGEAGSREQIGQPLRRPLVQCDTDGIAKKVTRQINIAKEIHEELLMTLRTTPDSDEQEDA